MNRKYTIYIFIAIIFIFILLKNFKKLVINKFTVTKGNEKVYVSLTSMYDRQENLCKTLKSILNQTKRPNKIYLNLSEDKYLLDEGFKNKIISNKNLSSLLKNNSDLIDVKFVENTGPYRKLLPTLKEKWNEDCLIITVDDDVEYSQDLVEKLVNDYKKYNCVIGYRGRWPNSNDKDKNLKNFNYLSLGLIKKNKSLNKYNFLTGKGSVLYHPKFFHKTGDLIFNKNIFKKTCPTNDDIWFHLIRVANNINSYCSDTKWFLIDNTDDDKNKKLFGFNGNNIKNKDKNTIMFNDTLNELIPYIYR